MDARIATYLEDKVPPHPLVWFGERQTGRVLTLFNTLFEYIMARQEEPFPSIQFAGGFNRYHLFIKFGSFLEAKGYVCVSSVTVPIEPDADGSYMSTYVNDNFHRIHISTSDNRDAYFGDPYTITVIHYDGEDNMKQTEGKTIILAHVKDMDEIKKNNHLHEGYVINDKRLPPIQTLHI